MSPKTIFSALLIFNSLFSFSQKRLITCSTQPNPDKTVGIYANSEAYGEYTVKLTFSSLTGLTSRTLMFSDIAIVPVNRGNSEIIKFTRENSNTNPSIQYKYQYFAGRSFHKTPDTTFEYLLPASAGNHVRVAVNSTTVSPMSQQLKTEYRGTGFTYRLNDTICASRAGIVYECSDTAMEAEKVETSFRRGRNRVQVIHRDGTVGIYGITAPIKLLVAPGDEVFPGQPLAVFNTAAERNRMYFSVCYLDEKKILANTNSDNGVYYTYMPAVFYAQEDDRSTNLQPNKEYIVQHPKNIIAEEMTKKEKKKFGL